jgi:hypothetical protein
LLFIYVGALTNKTYLFRARPWELQTIDTVDILDTMVSNIRVDIQGLNIVRILPSRNDSVNYEWITDKIRFSYDSFKRQRLFYPMFKEFLINLFIKSTINFNKFNNKIFIKVSWNKLNYFLQNLFNFTFIFNLKVEKEYNSNIIYNNLFIYFNKYDFYFINYIDDFNLLKFNYNYSYFSLFYNITCISNIVKGISVSYFHYIIFKISILKFLDNCEIIYIFQNIYILLLRLIFFYNLYNYNNIWFYLDKFNSIFVYTFNCFDKYNLQLCKFKDIISFNMFFIDYTNIKYNYIFIIYQLLLTLQILLIINTYNVLYLYINLYLVLIYLSNSITISKGLSLNKFNLVEFIYTKFSCNTYYYDLNYYNIIINIYKYYDRYTFLTLKNNINVFLKCNRKFYINKINFKFNLGSFVNLQSLYAYKDFINKFNLLDVSVIFNSVKYPFNEDFIKNYNSFSLFDLQKFANIILVGVNLRYEMPILNAKLRKFVINNNIYMYSFGFLNNLNYCCTNLGLSTIGFLKLFEGCHKICSILISKKQSLILLGSKFLKYRLNGIFLPKNIIIDYIFSEVVLLNVFELGGFATNYFNKVVYKNKNINYINYDFETLHKHDFFDLDKFMLIYHGNTANNILNYYDIIIPNKNFIEKPGYFINYLGIIQKSNLILNSYVDVLSDVNICYDTYISILKIFKVNFYLFKELKSYKLNIYKNLYLYLCEFLKLHFLNIIYYKYNKLYFSQENSFFFKSLMFYFPSYIFNFNDFNIITDFKICNTLKFNNILFKIFIDKFNYYKSDIISQTSLILSKFHRRVKMNAFNYLK